MAKSTPAEVVISVDNSGGTPVDISQYVTTINDIEVEQLVEQTDSFGDSWDEFLPIGKGKVAQITLGGFYDDTASTGPDAVLKISTPDTPSSTARTLQVTFRSGKSVSVETWRVKYKRGPARNGLTKWESVLQPTGATTEA